MPQLDLTKRHPYYAQQRPAWAMAEHHYDGGRSLERENRNVTPRYLKRFWTESNEDYTDRLDRAMLLYDNLPRKALHVYQSQLYRVKPVRTLPSRLAPALANIDLLGTSADDFFERVTAKAKLLGVFGVLVDGPPLGALRSPDGAAVSEAVAQVQNLRPWCELLSPLNIIDWDWEREDPARRGQLNWVTILDQVTRGREPLGQGGEELLRYRVYRRNTITTYEVGKDRKRGRDDDGVEMPNHLGEVPLVLFYADFEAPMQAQTIFDDVVLSANALWNTWSVLDEGFYHQGFEILTFATDDAVSEIKVGERAGLKIPKDAKVTYTAPTGVPAEMGMRRINAIVDRVADLVFNRTARAQLPSAAPESGEKREQDRQEFLALLEQHAGSAERGEEAVLRLLARAWGEAKPEVKVVYNRHFQVTDRAAEEWIAEVEEGIASKAEWYMARHPNVTNEAEAWVKVKENLAKNREVGGAAQEREAMAAQLRAQLGAGTDADDSEEEPAPGDEEEEEEVSAA